MVAHGDSHSSTPTPEASHSHGGSTSGAPMIMTFFSATNTPLYSTGWTPTSAGAYAGTCIFLIILAILYRGGYALKDHLENKWLAAALKRKYVVVADKTPIAERVSADTDSKTGILTANGVEENVRMVAAPVSHTQPWRFSVDLPRAGLTTVNAGIGYLL